MKVGRQSGGGGGGGDIGRRDGESRGEETDKRKAVYAKFSTEPILVLRRSV